jgi:hypothetical protein
MVDVVGVVYIELANQSDLLNYISRRPMEALLQFLVPVVFMGLL